MIMRRYLSFVRHLIIFFSATCSPLIKCEIVFSLAHLMTACPAVQFTVNIAFFLRTLLILPLTQDSSLTVVLVCFSDIFVILLRFYHCPYSHVF